MLNCQVYFICNVLQLKLELSSLTRTFSYFRENEFFSYKNVWNISFDQFDEDNTQKIMVFSEL